MFLQIRLSDATNRHFYTQRGGAETEREYVMRGETGRKKCLKGPDFMFLSRAYEQESREINRCMVPP